MLKGLLEDCGVLSSSTDFIPEQTYLSPSSVLKSHESDKLWPLELKATVGGAGVFLA